jgi:HSP20 family protein
VEEIMRQLREDASSWSPAIDVCESAAEIVLHAEVPGSDPDEIDIHMEGQTLVLGGEKRLQRSVGNESFLRIERRYGRWQRTFRIETPVDASRVTASYDDGVLTVRLPKRNTQQTRTIPISIS